ncbi:putative kinase [Allocatelliglobosispora scoriae]|uniref:Putative kinase n=1 Tax=Allocatelliglobosispora scoriae TaxID=643052 RepID=A0A841BLX5_9ACTN|nr:AAA family ATPase [Allocatelliglobosispora scoriae]MBB5868256.1 putative kinase [Allocatelliglobosispora scoriae]
MEAGRVWVVAGPPGAGKTTAARALAGLLMPPGALLDKDTIYGGFVAAALVSAGRPPGEREGPWYDVHVKPHEYDGMAATAREIRGSGCPVVLCAPFTRQIRSTTAWSSLVDAVGGPSVSLLWLHCDPVTLLARLEGRGSVRDGQKLAGYAEFVATVQPDLPPVVPHVVLDNRRDGIGGVLAQLRAVVGAGAGGEA